MSKPETEIKKDPIEVKKDKKDKKDSKEPAAKNGKVKQFDNLKTLLKNAKSAGGRDLYAHIQEVFKKLILHYPDQALEKLEEVSYLIKRQGQDLKMEDFLVIEESRNYKELTDALQNYIDKYEPFFKKPQAEEEDQEPPEIGPIGYVPDLLADSKIFEWAGIGFGEAETYRIMKSLKKLATDTQAGNIRFFGKIHGTERDYYIAEGTLEGGDDEEQNEDNPKPADYEPRGTGINKFVYWVTDNVLNNWTKLPELLPSDIKASRQIKVTFSGNLERQIYTNPYFFGQEKHYLRAQIARISFSTTLCPKGLFRLVEGEDREIEENAPDEGELQMPSTIEMARPENWVHYTQNILKVSRISHMEPEQPEDAPEDYDIDVEKKKIEAADPYEIRLKPITQDKQVPVSVDTQQQPWIVKLLGDKNEYLNPINPKQKVNYGVVVVRSLQWPGSFTFYNQGRYMNVYVGNGQKYETTTYYPVHPPKIQEDPSEYTEYPEPFPLQEPYVEQQPSQEESNVEGAEEEEAD